MLDLGEDKKERVMALGFMKMEVDGGRAVGVRVTQTELGDGAIVVAQGEGGEGVHVQVLDGGWRLGWWSTGGARSGIAWSSEQGGEENWAAEEITGHGG